MSLVKIQRKGQMTLPSVVRAAIGLADGDLVDVKVSGGRIIVTPTLVVDRSQFPVADDDYTPEQRRLVDAQLAEGLEDIRKGRVSPKFNTAEEMLASLKSGPTTVSPRRPKTRKR
jgi:AbrB family looped-hinge helix DNA binding protein